jgi:response regulator RpfG family c-di-GMP phosphodiesterase
MSEKIINVLYVDDESGNLNSFRSAFRRDFNVFTAISSMEADIILSKENIHVLITDQRMPDTSGTALLADAVTKYPHQSRILLTGYADIEAVIDAINKGRIFRYLTKPWDEIELRNAIIIGYDMFIWNDSKAKANEEIKRSEEEINLAIKQKNTPNK